MRLTGPASCEIDPSQTWCYFLDVTPSPAPSMHKTTDTIGRYEIRGTLGQGVTGAVYRGWDTRLERDVAIKVLLVNHDDAK